MPRMIILLPYLIWSGASPVEAGFLARAGAAGPPRGAPRAPARAAGAIDLVRPVLRGSVDSATARVGVVDLTNPDGPILGPTGAAHLGNALLMRGLRLASPAGCRSECAPTSNTPPRDPGSAPPVAPEPPSPTLLGIGALGLLGVARRLGTTPGGRATAMIGRRRPARRPLGFEACEDRTSLTLIFVLNGNALRPASPGPVTADAARILERRGHRAIEIATPAISNPAALDHLAGRIARLAEGRPIGIVGFSAGGTLAARLAGIPSLRVTAALSCYGPADLADYLAEHRGDRFHRAVVRGVRFTPGVVRLLSGPIRTDAHVVGAFGLGDRNVVAATSAASFARVLPGGSVHVYPGPHGASIRACREALDDFLAHL